MKVSLQSSEIRIGSSIQEAKVAVALRNNVPYLLGREGIFKAFRITFEEYRTITSFREAAVRWTREESGINPKDPIFHVKPRDWGKGTENASKEVDETLYE